MFCMLVLIFVCAAHGSLIESDTISPQDASETNELMNSFDPHCSEDSSFIHGNSDVFIDELPSPSIEGVIHKITNNFVETLKTSKTWFKALLKYIHKEQRRRESGKCRKGDCMYKIPCYLSQRFRTMPLYEKRLKRARVAAGFDELRRRRRNLDAMATGPTSLDTDLMEKDTMTNCTGTFANYCYNAISCIYVKVLKSAACACRPGYTGLRCDLYDLSITLKTLSQFNNGTVDIDLLPSEESATIYSILDATARYTCTTYTSEELLMFE